MTVVPMTAQAPPRARLLLALASLAVAFAAADTYVVVLALPDMMGSAGIPIDQLQRAAPIVSGFLLGYVAMLPLIGRIADVHGRVPVLAASLVVFAFGSLLTAEAVDLPSMVAGRFLQGVGGGGLVPATLALVADLYPVHRRGVPLGLVSAVQEIGSVLGPLFGAAVLAVTTWRGIFAVNLAVGLVLAAAVQLARTGRRDDGDADPQPAAPAGELGDPGSDHDETGRHAPGRGAADRHAPGRHAPDRHAPGRSAADRSAADRRAPDRGTPSRSASGHSAPDRTAPDRSAPDRTAPGHSAPDRTAPDRTAPGHSASDRRAPDRGAEGHHAPGRPAGDRSPAARRGRGRPDLFGLILLAAALAAGLLVLLRPPSLLRDLTLGLLWVPFLPGSRWLTPLGVATVVLAAGFVLRCLTARRPLVDLRAWGRAARQADLLGALLLSAALAGVVLAFATADPKVEVFSRLGLWYLLAAGVAAVLFALHLRRARHPVVPSRALRPAAAWGSLAVSFFVGAALIAALIDLPLFARTTVYPNSQLDAALVLVRFLVALPVGAVLGGWLLRRVPAGPVTAAGMACAAAAFVLMSRWGPQSLLEPSATGVLLLGGLGFGLALAPVNAAVLAATDHAVHGVASALVVVARMVGMLVGISALTTLGLRRFYAEQTGLPPVAEVCDGAGGCAEYGRLLQEAAIAQESVVFQGAAGCAVAAGILALVLFRRADTRGVGAGQALRSGG